MTYKYDKKIFILLIILLVSAIYFSISHIYSNGNAYKFIILGVLLIFIIFNIVSLLKKKITINDDYIINTALLGKKKIYFNDIKDAVFLYLKGRTILILSDDNQFVFISSLLENFDKIINEIYQKSPGEIQNKLSTFDIKKYKKSRALFIGFIIIAICFLIIFGTYNFITS
ncbi:hypothetical protein OWM07_05605 [Deferribacter thermophilus]|uniref:hypothetical protein n=1 Tax=Deferribacter thermophilus TaxID=53573 RepID=UPI003C16FEA6